MVDDIPKTQTAVTRFALQHPVRTALASGAAIAAWALLVVGDWRASAIAGIGTAVLAWFLWRPSGWARLREERLSDEASRRHDEAD